MASVLKVDKLDPQSGTALEIGTSGDTVSIPSGATLDISASTLTPPATLPASSGVNLTALNATNLGSGTVPTARLGSGTASSSTILYGDNTWAAASGAKIGQVLQTTTSTYTSMASTTYSTPITRTITPVATSSKILVMCTANFGVATGDHTVQAKINRVTAAAGTESFPIGDQICAMQGTDHNEGGRSTTHMYIDSPSETNEVTYNLVFRSSSATSVYLNNYSYAGANVSTLTVMEILA